MPESERPRDGVLSIDKPVGPTSHDVVATARRALRTRRIGHTGTLDPFASGLLMLCIGTATRVAEYLTGLDKTYSATVRLGVATDTDDSTGAVLSRRDPSHLSLADVERAFGGLRGSILQVPPQYSAKKVEGRRAYAVARDGGRTTLEPVPIVIHRLVVTGYAPPDVHMDVHCSSGTYVRAIARDVGEALAVGAHLTALRRTAIGRHTVTDAISLDALRAAPDDAADRIMPTLSALDGMPQVELDPAQVEHVRHGRAVECGGALQGTVALKAHDALIAIGDAAAGVIRPRKVFM
jgi:tRNA pseudouridine55 synthase